MGRDFRDHFDDRMAIMTTANFKDLVLEMLKRAEFYLASVGAERRCAMRLDRIADRLLGMGERITMLRDRMQAGFADEPVDDDHALRDSLKGLKEDIRSIRCQLAGMHRPQLSPRLQRAFSRLGKVAEATYAVADKLQWEIEEHDGKFVV
jgi:hypothetical protein